MRGSKTSVLMRATPASELIAAVTTLGSPVDTRLFRTRPATRTAAMAAENVLPGPGLSGERG